MAAVQKPTMNSLPMEKVDSFMNDNDTINTTTAIASAAAAAAATPAIPKPKSAESNVRVLELHEWKEAALSLAEAFKDDHVSRYFIDVPDRSDWTEEQKWDLHVKIMEYITYAHLLKGLVVSAGPNYDCVALW